MPRTATSRNGESFLAFLRFFVESWPSLAARFFAMACFFCICAAVQRGDGRAMHLVCGGAEATRAAALVLVRLNRRLVLD